MKKSQTFYNFVHYLINEIGLRVTILVHQGHAHKFKSY